jgi:hypothetical protein
LNKFERVEQEAMNLVMATREVFPGVHLKKLAKCFMRNYTEAEDGQPLKWLKTKWFQMNKVSPSLLFKYNYADKFSTLNFLSKPVKKTAAFVCFFH